jgi:hypothetical protein
MDGVRITAVAFKIAAVGNTDDHHRRNLDPLPRPSCAPANGFSLVKKGLYQKPARFQVRTGSRQCVLKKPNQIPVKFDYVTVLNFWHGSSVEK